MIIRYFDIWPKNESLTVGQLMKSVESDSINLNDVKIIGEFYNEDAIHAIILCLANSLKGQLSELDPKCEVYLKSPNGSAGWMLSIETMVDADYVSTENGNLFTWRLTSLL